MNKYQINAFVPGKRREDINVSKVELFKQNTKFIKF